MSRYIDVVDQLLNEEESNTLDFKSDQYIFEGGSDATKSELLKDILAFANSKRDRSAYILVGIKDNKGGAKDIVGCSPIDDSDVQQFVNYKTQKRIEFSVSNISYDSSTITVIEIPVQRGPFFLKNDYGKLRNSIVYTRRGTSTEIATPDEILMDFHEGTIGSGVPKLKLKFNFRDNIVTDTLFASSYAAVRKDEMHGMFMGYMPSKDDIAFVMSYKEKLDSIRDVYPDGKEYFPYSTKLFLEKINKLEKVIHLCQNDIDKVGGRVSFFKRSFELGESDLFKHMSKLGSSSPVARIRLENYGKCPSEKLIIYIYGAKHILFLSREELFNESISKEGAEFNTINEIIKMARQIEKSGIPHLITKYEEVTGRKPDRLNPRVMSNISRLGSYDSKVTTWSIKNNTLIVNYNNNVLHNHGVDLDLPGVYLCPMLTKGELSKLKYNIHSANIPDPIVGELFVRGE